MPPEFQEPLRVCGWFTINRDKLLKSQADCWVFVLIGFKRHSRDFVVVPKTELERRLKQIHDFNKKTIHSYLWVTEQDRCWEARDLEGGKEDRHRIKDDDYECPVRDFTKFLNE
jgi:hypothetical protein